MGTDIESTVLKQLSKIFGLGKILHFRAVIDERDEGKITGHKCYGDNSQSTCSNARLAFL